MADCTQKILETKTETKTKKDDAKEDKEKIKMDDLQAKLDLLLKPQKGGVIRGLNFNMSQNEVVAAEKKNGLDLNSSSVTFDLTNDFRDETAKITYKYEEGKLKEVRIEAILRKEQPAENLYNEVKNFFEFRKNGQPLPGSSNVYFWEDLKDSKSGKSYEIQLEKMQDAHGIIISCYTSKQ